MYLAVQDGVLGFVRSGAASNISNRLLSLLRGKGWSDELIARLDLDLSDAAFKARFSEEWVDAWRVLGEFPNLRKIPDNLEVLDKVKGKFSYNGKVGQEALEEIFTGHRSAQKFIDNFKKYDEVIDNVDDITVTGIKSSSEVRILNKGSEVGKVIDGKLNVSYSGFGGDIVCDPNKTTTLLGKWQDPAGGGTKDIMESKLFKVGKNNGGANVLSFDGSGMTKTKQWSVNSKWLNEASQRGDIIRVVSDPIKNTNIWVNGIVGGEKSFFGMEVELLENLGYSFNAVTSSFIK